MVYACNVKWYYEDDLVNDNVIIVADGVEDCTSKIADYCGDEIEELMVVTISESDMLVFEENDKFYYDLIEHIENAF